MQRNLNHDGMNAVWVGCVLKRISSQKKIDDNENEEKTSSVLIWKMRRNFIIIIHWYWAISTDPRNIMKSCKCFCLNATYARNSYLIDAVIMEIIYKQMGTQPYQECWSRVCVPLCTRVFSRLTFIAALLFTTVTLALHCLSRSLPLAPCIFRYFHVCLSDEQRKKEEEKVLFLLLASLPFSWCIRHTDTQWILLLFPMCYSIPFVLSQ